MIVILINLIRIFNDLICIFIDFICVPFIFIFDRLPWFYLYFNWHLWVHFYWSNRRFIFLNLIWTFKFINLVFSCYVIWRIKNWSLFLKPFNCLSFLITFENLINIIKIKFKIQGWITARLCFKTLVYFSNLNSIQFTVCHHSLVQNFFSTLNWFDYFFIVDILDWRQLESFLLKSRFLGDC